MSVPRGRFLEDAAVSLAASAGASVLNLAQLVLCGRVLDKGAFGAFSSLLACLWLGTVFANTLSLEITRLVAGGSGTRAAVAHARRLGAQGGLRSWLLLAGVLATSPVLAFLLHTGIVEILATFAALAALLACSVAQGVTAGLRRFRLQGGLALGGGIVKLAGTGVILAVSPSVLGAVLGSALGYLFVSAGTFLAVGRGAASPGAAGAPQPSTPAAMDARLAAAYFLSFAPFMADQLVVQAVAPGLAGDYAALATLGKLVFHAVAPALAVLYPYLLAHRLEPRLQKRTFRTGMTLVLALSGAGAALISLYPSFAVDRLFSARYAAAVPLLPAYALGVVAFTLAHGIALLFLARAEHRMLAPLAVTFLVQIALLLARHGSLAALCSNQVLAYSLMAGAMLLRLRLSETRPAGMRA